MRTLADVRNKLLETLDGAVRRPLMYGGTDHCSETVLWYLLHDLFFIDGLDDGWSHISTSLRNRLLSSATGVTSHLKWHLPGVPDVSQEMASIYAYYAVQYGYIKLDRTLSRPEWNYLRRGLRALVTATDLSTDEVIVRFGPPSLRAHRVLAYASEQHGDGWVYFDFDRADRTFPGKAEGILRDARIPATTIARELAFTPYGSQFSRRAAKTSTKTT